MCSVNFYVLKMNGQWWIQEFWKGVSLVVDPRCMGSRGAVRSAEEVLVFINI